MNNEVVTALATLVRYFRSMRWTVFVALLFLSACGGGSGGGDLCDRTFQPYPDLVSDRLRTKDNGVYLDAMALYVGKDFAGAAEGLETYLRRRDAERSARLYLACCYLALERPFDAELQLDRLEQSPQKADFKEQCEWYTVICLLCSNQTERAIQGAQAIAGVKRHTYATEAAALLKALTAP